MKKLIFVLMLLPFCGVAQQNEIVVPKFDFAKASKQAHVLPPFFDPVDREEQAIEGMKLGAMVMTLGLVALSSAFIVANVDKKGDPDTQKLIDGLALGGSGIAAIGAIGFTVSLGNLQKGTKQRKANYNADDIIRN